jgi:2-polyprenyl-3-methyl-5-hydroxy-6-metoxy-1,4-benzoquinol methylase
MDLKELDLVDPSTHWYYQAKLAGIRYMVHHHLFDGMRITDVGAGSGFFSIALAEGLGSPSVTCVDPHYPEERTERNGSLRFVRSLDKPIGDLYLFIDVLEHVDDDLSLLRQYVDFAPTGSVVVISVPAFQSLWSAHDVFLEHRRRYRMRAVKRLAEESGIEVTDARYLFGSIFPIAWSIRRMRRLKEPRSDMKAASPVVNKLLKRLLTVEHRLVTNRIFGLSIVVMGVVRGHSH